MPTLDAVVTARRDAPGQTVILELGPAGSESLPDFEPGAHIDLHLPGGLVRQYSLCNDPGANASRHYRLGVKLEPTSRGGSRAVHDCLWPGKRLAISAPRNLFRLDPTAGRHVMVAGGIGITPILSMILSCERRGVPWSLLYCGRSVHSMAFLDSLPNSPQVEVHADDTTQGMPDLQGVLANLAPDAHVYCCGPGPLMDAVERIGQECGVDLSRLHFERFAAEPAPAQTGSLDRFEVHLARSGRTLPVGPEDSILSVLAQAGIDCPSSCEQGVCGTCRVGLLEGRPDHRDYVLSEVEREANDAVFVCVSRSLTPRLVLDL